MLVVGLCGITPVYPTRTHVTFGVAHVLFGSPATFQGTRNETRAQSMCIASAPSATGEEQTTRLAAPALGTSSILQAARAVRPKPCQ